MNSQDFATVWDSSTEHFSPCMIDLQLILKTIILARVAIASTP
ncbi:hypothetical protein MJO29_000684 [Puccinia striiformis f. sp. tritici]|nr:hypothetical protein MJO29_000684 [Puccinia striiformis f. sp. tritici]